MTQMNLEHLDGSQHLDLARHLAAAIECLSVASAIVASAAYTDETLRLRRLIHETLVDPLRREWDRKDWGGINPYPSSVGYVPPERSRPT